MLKTIAKAVLILGVSSGAGALPYQSGGYTQDVRIVSGLGGCTLASPCYYSQLSVSTQAVVQTSAPLTGTNMPMFPITIDPAWTGALAVSTTTLNTVKASTGSCAAGQAITGAYAGYVTCGSAGGGAVNTTDPIQGDGTIGNPISLITSWKDGLAASSAAAKIATDALSISSVSNYTALNSTAGAVTSEIVRAISRENLLGNSTGYVRAFIDVNSSSITTLSLATASIMGFVGVKSTSIAALSISTASIIALANVNSSSIATLSLATATLSSIKASTGINTDISSMSALSYLGHSLILIGGSTLTVQGANSTGYSLSVSSGIDAGTGTVRALMFVGNGAALTGLKTRTILYETAQSSPIPASTSLTTLGIYTLPANTLANINDSIYVVCEGTAVVTSENKLLVPYFGGVALNTVVNSAAIALRSDAFISKRTAALQNSISSRMSTAVAMQPTALSATDTNTIDVECRGQSGTGGELGGVTMTHMLVEYVPSQ